jgi:hypothetical protein
MTPHDDGEGELQAGLALGSELLGLVSAEEDWSELPAFFEGAPIEFDSALEDESLGRSGVGGASILTGLSNVVGAGEVMGRSFWSFGGSSSGWGSTAAPFQHFPKTAFATSGVTSGGFGSSPLGVRDNLPDDRELDALMATLVCR